MEFKPHATCGVMGYREPLWDIVLPNESARQMVNHTKVVGEGRRAKQASIFGMQAGRLHRIVRRRYAIMPGAWRRVGAGIDL